jgi:hypothetical protein
MRTRVVGASGAVAAVLGTLGWHAAGATAAEGFRSSIKPLPAQVREQLTGPAWRPGCPVALSGLRLLSVTHWDFGGRARTGQLVVNEDAAAGLARVFRQLYALRFPIRHMRLADMYGPSGGRPDDVTASFECRQSVPSPCTGGTRSGRWSNHAYGLAIDINPRENPYVGCGRTRERTRAYLNRSRLRPGMVTPAVVRAFRSIGWGWGGDWTGATKDWMHFSWNGR